MISLNCSYEAILMVENNTLRHGTTFNVMLIIFIQYHALKLIEVLC